MEAERVLIIVLAAALLVLLSLAIVFVVLLIAIVRSLRRITSKAESATDSLSETLRTVSRRLAPMALTTVLGAAVRRIRRAKK